MSRPKCQDCGLHSLDEPVWQSGGILCGRNDMPALLWDAFADGELSNVSRERLRLMIADAWCSAEFPALNLESWMWRELFCSAGYVTDCRRIRRPRAPRTLWRGCAPGGESGMSWTDDRSVAEWFANSEGKGSRPVGRVVSAVVPADMVLARIVHGRSEAEWVLDPDRVEELTITEGDKS